MPLIQSSTGPVAQFTEGVPEEIDVSALLPAGADRYYGRPWYIQQTGYAASSAFNWITGVYYKAPNIIGYDGTPLYGSAVKNPNTNTSPNASALNPNPGYAIGAETGPYNAHWQFPPTLATIPPPKLVNGAWVTQAIQNGCKHVRPYFCAWDGLVRMYGGDYASYGLTAPSNGQNSRPLMFRYDPVADTWALDYPVKGLAGDQVPLAPDTMGVGVDNDRQKLWITFGTSRAGYWGNNVPNPLPTGAHPDFYWKGDGGIADAFPENSNDQVTPLFIYDPKIPSFKLVCAAPQLNVPWPQDRVRYIAYHHGSKRIYCVIQSGDGITVYWLDTTNFETAPTSLAWQSQDVKIPAPHAAPFGPGDAPLLVDEVKNVAYFFDTGTAPAMLALTLPGNAGGAHHASVVAELGAYMVDLAHGQRGLASVSTSNFVWCSNIRRVVVLAEPTSDMVGPRTTSITIDVDAGTVAPGPRFPAAEIDGMPWFPNNAFWIPTTSELVLSWGNFENCGAHRSWDRGSMNNFPQTMARYKWNP